MDAISLFQQALAQPQFIDPDDSSSIALELLPGLHDSQIERLQSDLHRQREQTFGSGGPPLVPPDVVGLLRFSSGFRLGSFRFSFVEFSPYQDWSKTRIFELPDGLGGQWRVEIEPNLGRWGPVLYWSVDPAVVVYQAGSYADFIEQILTAHRAGQVDALTRVQEEFAIRIWRENPGLLEASSLRQSGDEVIRQFASTLPEAALIADLRNGPEGAGISLLRWGKKTRFDRHPRLPIFAVSPPERTKRGLFGWLLGE